MLTHKQPQPDKGREDKVKQLVKRPSSRNRRSSSGWAGLNIHFNVLPAIIYKPIYLQGYVVLAMWVLYPCTSARAPKNPVLEYRTLLLSASCFSRALQGYDDGEKRDIYSQWHELIVILFGWRIRTSRDCFFFIGGVLADGCWWGWHLDSEVHCFAEGLNPLWCAKPHQRLRPTKGALQRAGLSGWMPL